MLIHNFIVDFKKILIGYGFYAGILLTTIMCIFSPVYYNFFNSENYTFIKCLIEYDKEDMLNDASLSSYNVAIQGAHGFLSMFAPIIVAFASVPVFCDEYNSGNARFIILRTNKRKYRVSKYLSSSICGGMVLWCGFCIYIVSSYIFFPDISNYSLEIKNTFEESIKQSYPNFVQYGYWYVLLRISIEIFFYGVMTTIPSIILTSFVKNKYIIICLPFFLKYVIVQTCNKLSSESMEKSLNNHLLNVIKTVNPDSLSNISIYPNLNNKIIGFNIALFVVGLILFTIISEAKYDCGE